MGRKSTFGQAIVISLVALSLQLSVPTVRAQDDVSEELSRAEAFYYRADFQSSLALLLNVEKRIANDSERTNERLKVNLYLGLVYLGLSENEKAKSKFVEICISDPDYALNPQQYPPKAIALFEDVKASCNQNNCAEICNQVDSLINDRKFDAAETRLKSASGSCLCAVASARAINDARFLQGKELYSRNQFAEAAKLFAAIVDSDESHQPAREYLGLSRERIKLSTELAFSEWRATFDSHQFGQAAAAYEKIRSASADPLVRQLTSEVESEYRKTLSGLVASWKTACEGNNGPRMDQLRRDALDVISGLELGNSVLVEMEHCAPLPCIMGDPALALRRLRTRIDPHIDTSLWRYLKQARVDIAIDEDGTVTVKNVLNADARLTTELKNAVEKWRFYPTVVDNHPRCIETQLPFSLILR